MEDEQYGAFFRNGVLYFGGGGGGGGTPVPANEKIYFVRGTQTATTGDWKGGIDAKSLVDGMTIAYFLPTTSATTTTLQLTFSDGSTSSKIPVYLNGTTSASTKYVANSIVYLTYNAEKDAFFSHYYATTSNTYYSLYCSTGGSTAAKQATQTSISYTSGSTTILKNPVGYKQVFMTNNNTKAGALTFAVGTGSYYTEAKPIYINGQPSSATNYTLPAGHYIVRFDGEKYDFRTDGKLPGFEDYDELKSKVEGVRLSSNDLNTLNVPGNYHTRARDESNTLTNTPKDGQWIAALTVQCINLELNNVVQILTDGIDVYFRASYGAASAEQRSWRDWKRVTATTVTA